MSFIVLLPFIQQEFHISLIEIGFLTMIYTVSSIASSFYAGHINEKLGNKNILLLAIGFYAVAWFGFIWAHSSVILWLLFICGGISSGIISPIADAIIMKQADEHKRAKEIGDFAATGDLGRIAFTTLTSLLVGFVSLQVTAGMYWIIASSLFIFLFLHTINNQIELRSEKLNVSFGHIDLIKSKEYLLSVLAGICDSFASSTLFIFLPFLLIQKGIDIKVTGLFTALFFAGYFSGRLFLGRFADKHGKANILIVAEIFMMLLTVSLVFVNPVWLIAINLYLLGIVTRGTSPLIKAMVADAIKIDHFEKGYSLYSASVRTSNSLSRPTYSFIGSMFGIGSIFYVSGFVALLTIIPAVLFYKATSKS